jgi:hypothetical protein
MHPSDNGRSRARPRRHGRPVLTPFDVPMHVPPTARLHRPHRRLSVGPEAAARLIHLNPWRRRACSADHKSGRRPVQLAGLCPVRSSRARRADLAGPDVSARAAIGRSVAIIGSASRGRSAPPRS